MIYVLSALALVALLPLVSAQGNNITLLTLLQMSKIIPDVIPDTFIPRFPLLVVFTDDTGTMFPVTVGANLTMKQTAKIPSFAIVSNNSAIIGKPYLIAMVDADAPTPSANQNHSQFRHFLAADFISDGFTGGDNSDGPTGGEFVMTNHSKTATLTDYMAPGPPATSPPHRYVILCYLQNSTGVTPPPGFNASARNNFNVTHFVDTVPGNNFTLLGATFFFVSANDTTGSVKPNITNGGPTATAPAGGAGGSGSGATKLGAAVAWSVVGVLTAAGALFL